MAKSNGIIGDKTEKEVMEEYHNLELAIKDTQEAMQILPEYIDIDKYKSLILNFLNQTNDKKSPTLSERVYRLGKKVLSIQREVSDPTPYMKSILDVLGPLEDPKLIVDRCNDISHIITTDKTNKNFFGAIFLETFQMLSDNYQKTLLNYKDSPSNMKQLDDGYKSELALQHSSLLSKILTISKEYAGRYNYQMADNGRQKFIEKMKQEIENQTGLFYPRTYEDFSVGGLKDLLGTKLEEKETHLNLFERKYGAPFHLKWDSTSQEREVQIHLMLRQGGIEKQHALTYIKGDVREQEKMFLMKLGELAKAHFDIHKNPGYLHDTCRTIECIGKYL